MQKLLEYIKRSAWMQSALFVVTWLGVWILAYLVEYVNHASVWFPAAGLTFAGLLVVGIRAVPLLFLCAIISTLWTGYFYDIQMSFSELFFSGIVFAFTHILPYFIAAQILKRLANNKVSQLPTLALLFLIVAVISSFVTTFSVLSGLAATNMMNFSDISAAWLPFWIGDMAGIIAMGPFFVGILGRLYPTPQFWIGELRDISGTSLSNRFILKLLGSGMLLTAVMLIAYKFPVQESQFAIFIMLIPLMWISYTESPVRTAITVAAFSFYTAFLVNLFGLMDHVIIYQFAICIIAGSSFFYLSVPSLLAHNQTLRHRAITDNLTGAASRYHLLNQAQMEIMRCHAEQLSLSLIVFDLDNFKEINDLLGHAKGDWVLKRACDTARLKLRRTDLLGRYGGDEFVILMPDSRLVEAKQKAENIRAELQQIIVEVNWKLGCSFGVSELQENDDFMQLFDRADKALYRAKKAGRNQVSI